MHWTTVLSRPQDKHVHACVQVMQLVTRALLLTQQVQNMLTLDQYTIAASRQSNPTCICGGLGPDCFPASAQSNASDGNSDDDEKKSRRNAHCADN